MTSVGFFANAEDAGSVQSLADFATYDYRPDSRPFDLGRLRPSSTSHTRRTAGS